MNKNTDAVPAGVAALYADIIAHPAEEWKASGSELPYLGWVELQKAGPKKPEKFYKVRVFITEETVDDEIIVTDPVALSGRFFTTKAAAEKFVAELEDFA